MHNKKPTDCGVKFDSDEKGAVLQKNFGGTVKT
jgi:hypothetical protein